MGKFLLQRDEQQQQRQAGNDFGHYHRRCDHAREQGPSPEATEAGDEHRSCGLDWLFTQTGNDVTIVVDEEYRLEGRLCADRLSLRGGWWLPVVDEDVGGCTYEDDSAEEVGIMSDGNVLTVTENPMDGRLQMIGTLSVQGRCSADYDVTFDHQ